MFLDDLRELEARIRTEKLAAMGRMSAAVAHEIRNPLAAITQASALLGEDLHDPSHRRLTAMVEHNAQRLARIVDDVLDVARVRQQHLPTPAKHWRWTATVRTLAEEWVQQTGQHRRAGGAGTPRPGRCASTPSTCAASWSTCWTTRRAMPARVTARSAEHRTRTQRGAARCASGATAHRSSPAVQRHLFEPFFSSESRSSGLGLFICRELCERHGALDRLRAPRAHGRGLPRATSSMCTSRRPADARRPPLTQ